jgi:hypothetical protein
VDNKKMIIQSVFFGHDSGIRAVAHRKRFEHFMAWDNAKL